MESALDGMKAAEDEDGDDEEEEAYYYKDSTAAKEAEGIPEEDRVSYEEEGVVYEANNNEAGHIAEVDASNSFVVMHASYMPVIVPAQYTVVLDEQSFLCK